MGTEGGRRWKIRKPDAPRSELYKSQAHFEGFEAEKKKQPGTTMKLPVRQNVLERLVAGERRKEWWFCNRNCKKLYQSGKFDENKLAKRQADILKKCGVNGDKNQKLCLLCLQKNNMLSETTQSGDDIDGESSDVVGRSGD